MGIADKEIVANLSLVDSNTCFKITVCSLNVFMEIAENPTKSRLTKCFHYAKV